MTSEVDARPEPRVWRVSQVNRAVRRLLEGQLESLWISGEIANWKRAASGHCYFTLKDDTAQIRAVLFRADAARLPIDPQDGMEVRLFGNLTLYEARGEYQFTARSLEAEGDEGLWRKAFDQLKSRLDAEGLTATDRKRPLPRFPRTIGVVTSTSGAALRDILSVLRRRAPWVRVMVAGTRVQGEGAALEIAEAVRRVTEWAAPDVVIVGRGGGSIEDLWAFNEEPVARAVVASPVPVVSGVGHETDVTISDLVADLRAPTPSAAAEAVVPDADVLRDTLRAFLPRMGRGVRAGLERRERAVVTGPDRLARSIQRRLAPIEIRLDGARDRATRGIHRLLDARARRADVSDRLLRAVRARIDRGGRELAAAAGRLEALSPLAVLRRGYAVPLDPSGTLLRSTSDFLPGSAFELRVADGVVEAETRTTRSIDDGIQPE